MTNKYLNVEIFAEQITIKTINGNEIVHWIIDEWEDDPSVTPVIAEAIRMAYEQPGELMRMHAEHIRSQLLIRSEA